MFVSDMFALILLGLALGAQVFLRPFWVRYLKTAWVVSVFFIFGIAAYWSWSQYALWSSSHIFSPFLAPHYFFRYIGLKFFVSPLIALITAVCVSLIARYFNHRFSDRFFESEEIALMQLGIFLVGYPGFFLYLILIFLGGIFLSLIYIALSKGRAPSYYLWLPTAIFAILIKIYILPPSLLAPFILR